MFHVGHLNILLRAREHCDRLVVGVVADDALSRQGPAPVVPQSSGWRWSRRPRSGRPGGHRLLPDKFEVWEQLQYDVLFKGDDWKGTAKGDPLEAAWRRSVSGSLLPVHRAHLEHPAALAAHPALSRAYPRPQARQDTTRRTLTGPSAS